MLLILTPFCSFLFKTVLDTGIHTHSSVEASHLKHGGEQPEIKQNKNQDNDNHQSTFTPVSSTDKTDSPRYN
jgi:hypothetical protein